MRLFSTGNYLLHSGATAKWIIDCRALSKYDWEALAAIAMEKFQLDFIYSTGIPKGGLDLAHAMQSSRKQGYEGKVLICDDVYTTGNNFNKFKQQIKGGVLPHDVIGLVAFARKKPTEDWIHAIWTLS